MQNSKKRIKSKKKKTSSGEVNLMLVYVIRGHKISQTEPRSSRGKSKRDDTTREKYLYVGRGNS